MLQELRGATPRRIVATAVCVIGLTAGYMAVPAAAHAEGPLGGLLGSTINATGSLLEDVTTATGLDQVVTPNLSSGENGIEAGVSVPAAGVNAQATVGGSSIASANAQVSPGTGDLATLDVNGTVGGDSVASVDTNVTVGGGQLLSTSTQTEVAGSNGLITAGIDAHAVQGELLDVQVDTTVAGDALLDVNVSASVLDTPILGGGVVVDDGGVNAPIDVLPTVPGDSPGLPGNNNPTVPAPEAPGSPETPASVPPTPGAVPNSPVTANSPAPAINVLDTNSVTGSASNAPGSSSTSVEGPGSAIPRTVTTSTPAESPAMSEAAAAGGIAATPSSTLANSLLDPALVPPAPRGDESLIVAGQAAEAPNMQTTRAASSGAGLADLLGGASAALSAMGSSFGGSNAPLAMLASLALLGAALLVIAGQGDRFRPPLSQSYLPPVPPG